MANHGLLPPTHFTRLSAICFTLNQQELPALQEVRILEKDVSEAETTGLTDSHGMQMTPCDTVMSTRRLERPCPLFLT